MNIALIVWYTQNNNHNTPTMGQDGKEKKTTFKIKNNKATQCLNAMYNGSWPNNNMEINDCQCVCVTHTCQFPWWGNTCLKLYLVY